MKLEESSIDNILENLLKRSPNQYDTYQDTVAEILNDVKENGDKALFAYTEKFDKAVITKDTIKVTEEEIKEAYDQVDDSLIEVMKKSLANIRDFHEKQLVRDKRRRGYFGTACYSTRKCRCLCSGRKSSLSIQCIDEYNPG